MSAGRRVPARSRPGTVGDLMGHLSVRNAAECHS
jgi:hypothetical protein